MRQVFLTSIFLLFSFSLCMAQVTVSSPPPDTLPEMADDSIPSSVLPWPENVQQVLDSLLYAPLFETSQVAMMVYDLTADSTLYIRCPRYRMRPASTMKVLTAISVLDKLGADYPITTRLYRDGEVTDSLRTLNGNLYLRGAMDPRLGNYDLRCLVDAVVALGIDTLRGDICGDDNMKDGRQWGEGWCWDDDNPTLNPLLLNGREGLMNSFVNALRDRGLVVIGNTHERRRVPSGATLLTSRQHTIGDMLERCLKNSNNLYAEVLFYQLAASRNAHRASAKDAIAEERALLNRLGIAGTAYRLADGSGLSLYNYLTPEILVTLLRYAFSRPHIFTPLYAALPIAGVDGTLKGRMGGTAAGGNVRAKTGTLEGVSTLAGYCEAANGHMLCFAIMNSGLHRQDDGRRFQNRVCKALCQRYEIIDK
ncbi:MAG: D-alanyl-D-alanine carboxypeptidase/D-alanyl-D-alanine-endopeptidase [Bacteroidaceae bacterium]|nr:D-alanyl-D-alanine carboxypeptidase/D-alanyl-D-alanine-endopeptidase [Bacteroidaceae bacterium]